jgi:spermidine/putrescine transport system ATP-binding protein
VTALLELKEVGLSYGSTEVLHSVSLAIEDGEFLVILGPSGSGKTTILRLIGGFLAPTHGRITLDGRDIGRVPINRRPFNTVFQDYALFPHMTVEENVGYGLLVRGTRRAEMRAQVKRTLALVQLEQLGSRYPAQLSGGQQQRVALARAIICAPRLVLLDEPLGALDAELRRQMQRFLKKLQRDIRTTFLFITHDQEEAVTMADRICVMRAGRIEQVGTPEGVYYRPESEYVARFFGDNNLIPGRIVEAGEQGATIETCLGSFRSASSIEARNVSMGGDAILLVRPESIRIAPLPAEIGNRVRAKVREVSFVGPVTQVLLDPPDARLAVLMVKLASSATGPAIAAGDQVEIGWRDADAHVVGAQ